MSDWHDDSNAHAPEPGDAAVSWSQPSAARPAPVARERLDVAPLAPWLPRLGATLWLVRKCRRAHTPALLGARGVLLFDHPALTTLAATARPNPKTHAGISRDLANAESFSPAFFRTHATA